MEQIAPRRIIPVVVIEDYQCAAPLRAALMRGGLDCAEITCRTSAAIDAISAMAEDPGFVVGAGTVTTVDQVEQVVARNVYRAASIALADHHADHVSRRRLA